MSELTVGTLSGLSANNFVIDVASGSKIVQPGAILQVVSTTKTDTFSTSSGSFVDVTGLSATITPKATSSKILVLCNTDVGGANAARSQFLLVRDSTAISIGDSEGSRLQGTMGAGPGANDATNVGLGRDSVGFNFLDSPNTTSATTYKVQTLSSGTVLINRSSTDTNSSDSGNTRNTSTITLMEVAG
jgi:hypothetical protein